MKNLKYRSVMSAVTIGMLSVFLFTGCEKDAAVAPENNRGDIIEKFKRLKFQTVTTTSEENSSSTSTKNSTDFVGPTGGNDAEFAPSTGSNDMFTDPNSNADYFGVNGNFGFGGGSFNFNGENFEMLLGFCGSDLFGDLDSLGEMDEVDIFVGIAGDVTMEELMADTGSFLENGYIIYAISYNNSTDLINFYDYEDIGDEGFAAVMLMDLSADSEDEGMYFSTSGNIVFSGSQVSLSGVSMVNAEGDASGSLDANLECVSYSDFFTEERQ